MSGFDAHKLYGEPNPDTLEMLAARQISLELLDSVLMKKNALDQALEDHADFKSLPQRDRAFVRMLTATTLRRLGQIDDLIHKSEDKPGSAARTPVLMNILRLGVAQIIFMNVPDHAAVDTAVRLTAGANLEHQKGFVNGVLRHMTREGLAMVKMQDEGRLNTPEWLMKTWIADYGLKQTAQIMTANLTEAPLDITVKDPSQRESWSDVLEADIFPTGTLRRESGGSVFELEGFDDGHWWVQDASAAIPATLFGNIDGKTVIDLCAAPGGKTAQLASMGAHVMALDRSAQRLRKMEDNLKRLRLIDKVEAIAADASVWKPRQRADYILLDSPCTATGTMRRHPDLQHLKSPKDLESLKNIQQRLLRNAFAMLEPGGVLIYCTCSLQKSEGEDQVAQLLREEQRAFKLAIAPKEVGDLSEIITEHGDIRILPFIKADIGGMDGFFISRIGKSPA